MRKKIKASYYHDPSHGWYRVSFKALKALGLLDRITGWSYRHAESVYLEEDIDAGTFFEACKEKNIEVKVHRCIQESRCRVRRFNIYRPE